MVLLALPSRGWSSSLVKDKEGNFVAECCFVFTSVQTNNKLQRVLLPYLWSDTWEEWSMSNIAPCHKIYLINLYTASHNKRVSQNGVDEKWKMQERQTYSN